MQLESSTQELPPENEQDGTEDGAAASADPKILPPAIGSVHETATVGHQQNKTEHRQREHARKDLRPVQHAYWINADKAESASRKDRAGDQHVKSLGLPGIFIQAAAPTHGLSRAVAHCRNEGGQRCHACSNKAERKNNSSQSRPHCRGKRSGSHPRSKTVSIGRGKHLPGSNHDDKAKADGKSGARAMPRISNTGTMLGLGRPRLPSQYIRRE